jgi:hypothetical protein
LAVVITHHTLNVDKRHKRQIRVMKNMKKDIDKIDNVERIAKNSKELIPFTPEGATQTD